jgi:hypothetical protein
MEKAKFEKALEAVKNGEWKEYTEFYDDCQPQILRHEDGSLELSYNAWADVSYDGLEYGSLDSDHVGFVEALDLDDEQKENLAEALKGRYGRDFFQHYELPSAMVEFHLKNLFVEEFPEDENVEFYEDEIRGFANQWIVYYGKPEDYDERTGSLDKITRETAKNKFVLSLGWKYFNGLDGNYTRFKSF